MLLEGRQEPTQAEALLRRLVAALNAEHRQVALLVAPLQSADRHGALTGGRITDQDLASHVASPDHHRTTGAHHQGRQLQAGDLGVIHAQLRGPQAHQISDGRQLEQADPSTGGIPLDLVLEDPGEDVLAEGQIEVTRQHPQRRHRPLHRALTTEVGEGAVIPKAPVPILQGLLLTLNRDDRRRALLPIGLQEFRFGGFRLVFAGFGTEHHHRWPLHRWRCPALRQETSGQLAFHRQLEWPEQLLARVGPRHIAAADQPGPPAGAELMLTGWEQEHLLLAGGFFELIARPIPQIAALGQAGRRTGGRNRKQFLQARLGQSQLQRRVLHHHLQEDRLGHQPELAGLGCRQRLPGDAPQQSDIASGVPW